MALIPCPECNAQISEKAHRCPRCGYPLWEAVTLPGASEARWRREIRPLGLILGFGLLVMGAGLLLVSAYLGLASVGLPLPLSGVRPIFFARHVLGFPLGFPLLGLWILITLAGLILIGLGGVVLAFGATRVVKTGR